MGKKGKWYSIKRAFIPSCCQGDPGERGLGKSKQSDPLPTKELASETGDAAQPPPPAPVQEVKLTEKGDEHNKHAYSVALASAVAAEAAAVAAQAAAEVVRLTTSTARQTADSKEDIAAIKIQTAFRGFLARKTLRTLRGLIRLRKVLDGNSVRTQTANTLRCMQTMARLQTQIRSRRIRMTEENQALQRHLLQKQEMEQEKPKVKTEEEWDDSLQTKEKIEANTLSKQEAAIRRERALAYAFSHQWRSSYRNPTTSFTDPSNPQWGWSWLERWMAARPWENHSMMEINDHASIASASCSVTLQTSKYRDTGLDRTPSARKSSRPSSRQSPATPRSKAPSIASRKKSVSPRCGHCSGDDDSRSMFSVQSERRRRRSLGGSSVRDDDSLVNSPAIPGYMASTESARARSRFHSPQSDRIGTPDSGSICSVKKRLSFPLADNTGIPSPASNRRHSGPPKIGIFPVKDVAPLTKEEKVSNN